IDLSPELLNEAKRLHPNTTFVTGDLFDLPEQNNSFDWVILSGALNEQLHDGSAYAYLVIQRMYQLCRKGIAFNMLDARHLKAHDLHTQQPQVVLQFCQTLSPHVTLFDDYLANDFTLHLRKENT
ncbi:MAG: class I SAM-dependent methyltransferase, partial [Ghiorsea sp.]|nr:class I SAM-dependent methyltransferase [Ghiorsea sp.]